jgi:predicted aldo/keto reductase-like oxidoreductase
MPGTGDELSILGYGCMRFQKRLGQVDMADVDAQMARALEAGVNYFDTAYIYPGNEKVVGTVLGRVDEKGKRRDRVHVATKLPSMLAKAPGDADRMFATSLERLGMEHVDYYLMHNLTDLAGWERLRGLGIEDFIAREKRSGRIRHIGFSWHGNLHEFRKVLDAYPWEFCQIQYNYLDENFQAGTEGLRYAASKGIGVIVMEPLRGGLLTARMPKAAAEVLDAWTKQTGVQRSPAEWGLRWVWNHPEVGLALSGMNAAAQVSENTRVASDARPDSLTDAELDVVARVADVFRSLVKVNCTGCSYCMPCPYGVDIPLCFAFYNSFAMFGEFHAKMTYAFNTRTRGGQRHAASACKKCGACAKKCPQHLAIPELLGDVAQTMEPPLLSAIMKLAGIIIR